MSVSLPMPLLGRVVEELPHPVVFATVSGSHLYGFPSVDSDFDLRAAHLLPGPAFWGLEPPVETIEPRMETEVGLVEVVSHDLRKFARLLLKRNGYVLEQLTSPLVVRTGPVHARLLELVPGMLTRHHYHHYLGFYGSERKEYDRSEPKSVKKLLYCYRVLMTGCVLLREGRVEANLPLLNRRFGLPFLNELIAIKLGGERAGLADDRPYTGELERLEREMEAAYRDSTLPEAPAVRAEVERVIVQARADGTGETR